jgi:hypothetical protein
MENISILIVNSSHASVDNVMSILKEKILSHQRPHIAGLSCHDFHEEDEMKNGNFESFISQFIAKELERSREALAKLKAKSEFNQLDAWKRNVGGEEKKKGNFAVRKSTTLKNQLCSLRREESRRIIVDFPIDENKIELYVILFDVYDCEIIKSIQKGNDNILLGIVNVFARGESSDSGLFEMNSIKS